MNHSRLTIFLFLICSYTLNAQKWNWVQKIDGEKCESGMGIAPTPDGNFVVTGMYEDTGGAVFESQNGSVSKFAVDADTFPNSHSTLYLAKYTVDGNLLWKTNAFAANGITPWDLHVDSKGNSIISGNFRGMSVFHSVNGKSKAVYGTPPPYKSEGAPLNYYVAKYDQDGNLLWVKVARSSDHSVAFEAKTDAKDNIYVRAYCHYGSIAFDDYSLFPRSDSGRYTGNYSLIVVKYDPDGNEQWITRGGNFSIRQLDVTPDGNVDLYGSYESQAILFTTSGKKYLPQPLTTDGYNDMLLRLNTNGELESITKGFNDVPFLDLHKVIRDKQGNYYMQLFCYESSGMNRSWEFKVNDKTYHTKSYDTFLARYTPQKQLVWFTQITGQNAERPLDICLDESGDIIVTGHFVQHISLRDVRNDSLNLDADYQTMYLAAYSPEGVLKFAEKCGSLFNGFGEQLNLAIAPGNKLLIAGQLNVPSQIGPRKLDVKGEKGWNSPSWEKHIDFGRYSDAFIASISLNDAPDPGSIVLNLDLNLKEAAMIMASVMEKLAKAMDDAHLYIQFDEHESFVSAPAGEPLTYQSSGSTIQPLVFPNPAGYGQPEVTVQLTLPAAGFVKWTLQTQTGAVLQTNTTQYSEGLCSWQFSVSQLSAGVYNLVIEYNKQRILKRVIVQ